MNIFTLMGTILVDSEKAEESISRTGEKSEGLAKSLGDGLKKAAGVAAGALAAIGAAAVAMAAKAVTASDDVQKAMNSLQAKTGATAEEMDGLRDSMLSLYSQNFGESFEDIANSMGTIQQATGLTGAALENATKNAFILKDTFDMEVNESIRAVDMMMGQFGITSEEAFNLIAQGTQKGLNKNENLLDSINEYSVHFKQMGLDAEDMFNMFSNGAEAGVFDIDKLGDAVKEFGIRVKDESDSTTKAFADLGLDSNKLTKAFAAGGDTAKKAFDEVNQALYECDDKVLQNQAGVALYGTMWEDMGADTVIALSNLNGEFDKTKATMDEINEIKYDSFSEAIAGIGRQLEVGLLIPLGDSILPLLNDFTNFINEHMPEIQSVMQTVMDVIGDAIQSLETPINFIVECISFLADAITSWVNDNSEKIEEVKGTFEGFKTKVDEVFNNVKTLLDAFVGAFTRIWEKYGDDILSFISDTWDGIVNTIDGVFTLINDLLAVFTALFNGDWEALWAGLKKFAEDAWNEVTEWFELAIDIFNQIVSGAETMFEDIGESIIDFILTGLTSAWDGIASWFSDKIEWIQEKLGIWRNAQSEMSTVNENGRGGGGRSFDGSHALGLASVPYDGYIAELHAGERVLTRAEAEAYNSKGKVSYKAETTDTSRLEALMEQLIKTTNNIPRQMQINANMG